MPQTDAGLPEVARIAADLIRFDTSNFGGGDAKGEREAAEYVGAYLESLGLQPEYYEPIPRRTNVMARVEGREQGQPALVVHGHLDVVPAMAGDWSVDPFAGIVQDGMLWGRGAVDMKNMDAMILTSVAEILRAGSSPERPDPGVLRRRGERRRRGLRPCRAEPARVVRGGVRGDQ
jgi:acetylornithine deacetylase/succinyl-diaminopimelate desuccinylase-like protein